jgi:voltage-gated potassium channel
MFYFWRMFYEVLIILAVLTYAIIIFADPADHPFLTPAFIRKIDWTLITIFAVEYIWGLQKAERKWEYVKKNWFDLLAMIPFETLFPLARFVRVIRLLRILRESPLLWSLVTSKELGFIFLFVLLVLMWASTGVYVLEYGINESIRNFGDAFWLAIVTTTTVGYGDISPKTEGGRMIVAFLMITGIGLISTLTANLANHSISFFDSIKLKYRLQSLESDSLKEERVADDRLHQRLKEDVIRQLQHIESLSEQEYRTLLRMIAMLRSNQ